MKQSQVSSLFPLKHVDQTIIFDQTGAAVLIQYHFLTLLCHQTHLAYVVSQDLVLALCWSSDTNCVLVTIDSWCSSWGLLFHAPSLIGKFVMVKACDNCRASEASWRFWRSVDWTWMLPVVITTSWSRREWRLVRVTRNLQLSSSSRFRPRRSPSMVSQSYRTPFQTPIALYPLFCPSLESAAIVQKLRESLLSVVCASNFKFPFVLSWFTSEDMIVLNWSASVDESILELENFKFAPTCL